MLRQVAPLTRHAQRRQVAHADGLGRRHDVLVEHRHAHHRLARRHTREELAAHLPPLGVRVVVDGLRAARVGRVAREGPASARFGGTG